MPTARCLGRRRSWPNSAGWDGRARTVLTLHPDAVTKQPRRPPRQVAAPGRLPVVVFQENQGARRFYEDCCCLVKFTDGSLNMEKEPDALYKWLPSRPGRERAITIRSLARSLVSVILALRQERSHRETPSCTVAAQHLDRLCRLAASHLRGVELRLRPLGLWGRAPSARPREDAEARRLDLDRHVDELRLDRLMIGMQQPASGPSRSPACRRERCRRRPVRYLHSARRARSPTRPRPAAGSSSTR